MAAAKVAKPQRIRKAVFVPPDEAEDEEASAAPRTGSRRKAGKSKPCPLRWPATMSERRRLVRLWRRICMTLLQEDAKVMRLPAVVPDSLIWKDGEVWASNYTLAAEAGGCSEKTIQREVEWFRERGLLCVSYGWKRNQGGQLCKTRLMRLAVPEDYDGPVPDVVDPANQADTRGPFGHEDTCGPFGHEDTCGPHGEGDQADTRGPDRLDTRGPITVEQER